MPDTPLSARLRAYLDHPAARRLARSAPAAFVAGVTGTVLGAVIADPALAQTGLGLILSGVAVNLTSALVEPILSAPDDEARETAIDAGLAARDPDTAKLVAATVIHAGPDLARALPAPDLADALGRGLEQQGGPLGRLAPRYTAALRDPQADWPALQALLRSELAGVSQEMQADEQGVISGSRQEAESGGGRISQSMRATKGGRIENSVQITKKERGRG